MKKNKFLIIGIVGVLAFMYFKNRKPKSNTSENLAETSVDEVIEEVADEGLIG